LPRTKKRKEGRLYPSSKEKGKKKKGKNARVTASRAPREEERKVQTYAIDGSRGERRGGKGAGSVLPRDRVREFNRGKKEKGGNGFPCLSSRTKQREGKKSDFSTGYSLKKGKGERLLPLIQENQRGRLGEKKKGKRNIPSSRKIREKKGGGRGGGILLKEGGEEGGFLSLMLLSREEREKKNFFFCAGIPGKKGLLLLRREKKGGEGTSSNRISILRRKKKLLVYSVGKKQPSADRSIGGREKGWVAGLCRSAVVGESSEKEEKKKKERKIVYSSRCRSREKGGERYIAISPVSKGAREKKKGGAWLFGAVDRGERKKRGGAVLLSEGGKTKKKKRKRSRLGIKQKKGEKVRPLREEEGRPPQAR